jgi:hypothetical protein
VRRARRPSRSGWRVLIGRSGHARAADRPISSAQITRFGVTSGDRPADQVDDGQGTGVARLLGCPPVRFIVADQFTRAGTHPDRPKGQASGSHSGSHRWQIPGDKGRRAQTIRPAKCLAERCQATCRDASRVPSKQRAAGSNPAGRTEENPRSARSAVDRWLMLTTRCAAVVPVACPMAWSLAVPAPGQRARSTRQR